MADVTIFHNTACTTSRNTLALLRHAGIEPLVVEYLKTPPSVATLERLAQAMGVGARGMLRVNEPIHAELRLDDPARTDRDLLDAIVAHPILMNRPIVVTPLGTKLCRPCEEVLDLLPVGRIAPFAKENGERIEDTGDRRPPPA